MTEAFHRAVPRLTAIALIAVACALGGCGRKAGLDLPPSAALQRADGDAFQTPPAGTAATPAAATPAVFDPTPGSEKVVVAPRGEKKRIPLDVLLD